MLVCARLFGCVCLALVSVCLGVCLSGCVCVFNLIKLMSCCFRYILLYELITGSNFSFDQSSLLADAAEAETPDQRIIRDVKRAFDAGLI